MFAADSETSLYRPLKGALPELKGLVKRVGVKGEFLLP